MSGANVLALNSMYVLNMTAFLWSYCNTCNTYTYKMLNFWANH